MFYKVFFYHTITLNSGLGAFIHAIKGAGDFFKRQNLRESVILHFGYKEVLKELFRRPAYFRCANNGMPVRLS